MTAIDLKTDVPDLRVRAEGDKSVDIDGEFVLYWMIANRRTEWNYSLDRARDWALQLEKPLVILEALRCNYQWASDRLHAFVIQGMQDNQAACEEAPVFYYPYLEPELGAGSGLLNALAKRAAVVVTDDFPSFFIPAMLRAARRQVPVRFELVDSNGILPMRATDKVYSRAYHFRRYLQKTIRPHLAESPDEQPLAADGLQPPSDSLVKSLNGLSGHWPMADLDGADSVERLADLPIDHDVPPVEGLPGGRKAALKSLKRFLEERVADYEDRNQPQKEVSSGLSPYLHFGHISAHEIFHGLMSQESWTPDKLSSENKGSNSDWWGTSPAAESFLDELLTWREIGFNMTSQWSNYDKYESLPDWVQKTLGEHADDPREYVYTLEEFEQAKTHDELWNSAQRQLVTEGIIHNYLRMLWGKKILEWTDSPRTALDVMVELNNKYALDGRNPNSYSGIFWVLGRYDRAWGPERPVYGKIRYMSSDNTARKVKVKDYVKQYSAKELTLFD